MTEYPNYNFIDPVRLIESHLPQVRLMATRLAAKLPPWVEVNDLIGAGVRGLLDALAKYDSTKGVPLKTYVEHQARGAILNRITDIDWAPRAAVPGMFRKEACHQEPRSQSQTVREQGSTKPELSQAALQRLLQDIRGVATSSLEGAEGDCSQPSETERYFMEKIDGLPKLEREVIILYYLGESSPSRIGSIFGITESQVWQIQDQVVVFLRNALAAKRVTLAFSG